jgi:hypothetical protein
LRTLQGRLRGYRLQRMELEMAVTGEEQGRTNTPEVGVPRCAMPAVPLD